MSLPNAFGSVAVSAQNVWPIHEAIPELGFEFISDTAAHQGFYHRITCLSDGVINLGPCNVTGNAVTALALKAGTSISGYFTTLTAASGTFAAYKYKN